MPVAKRNIDDDLRPKPGPNDWGPRKFETISDGAHYRYSVESLGVSFNFDQLRRERGEIHGHITVNCALSGARCIDGNILLSGTTNLGSMQTRQKLGGMLADRANSKDIDWHGWLEEFALNIERAERTGTPSVSLRDVTPTHPDAECFEVYGLKLTTHHSTMLYGNGDTLKSQIELLVLGEIQRSGMNTMLVDWEMSAGDHASRLKFLYGDDRPDITYHRAERPLVQEVDRLITTIHDKKIEYAALDSVGFGCDGPPEEAESALSFMKAVRRLGIGTLLIAHQSKGSNGDNGPFGSAFWFNSCRVIYNIQRAEQTLLDSSVSVAAYPKKSNLYRRGGPVGLNFNFTDTSTTVERTDVAQMGPELSGQLSTALRMKAGLKNGPLSTKDLAEQIGAKETTIRQTLLTAQRQGWADRMKDGTDRIYLVNG